jgi:hypothetical protein
MKFTLSNPDIELVPADQFTNATSENQNPNYFFYSKRKGQ